MNSDTVCIGDVAVRSKALLAPMAGITDFAFRQICGEMGAGAVYTELISSDGLVMGSAKSERYLHFEESERPVGIQLFGADPEVMAKAARISAQFNPDIIDLNFGCPVRKVVKKMKGAALLKDLKLLREILNAVVESVDLPVTVKIRSGWSEDSINVIEVAHIVQEAGAAAITLHPRTARMGFDGRSNWDLIGKLKKEVLIPVIGNGDIESAEDASRMIELTGCDLVMVGRAARGNPWIFKEINHFLETGKNLPPPTVDERISLCIRHFDMLFRYYGERAAGKIKKNMGWYTKGIPGVADFRRNVFPMEEASDIRQALEKLLKTREHEFGPAINCQDNPH